MIERSKHGGNSAPMGDNIVSSLLASMYQDKPLPKTLAMTINMRSPRIYCLDDNYIGNAVHTIYEQGHSSASTFANIMERIIGLKRQLGPNIIDAIRQEFYQNLNLLENNITSAPHSLHRDVIFINNQLSFPMLPSFGLHNKCMRAIPGKGDDIHIIPSAKKGIDVYVSHSTMPRKMTSSALKRKFWPSTKKIFDVCKMNTKVENRLYDRERENLPSGGVKPVKYYVLLYLIMYFSYVKPFSAIFV